MKFAWGVALAALSLSACVTAEQRELALTTKDDTDCRSYGAAPGSQAYFQCRMTKDEGRKQRRATAEAAVLARPTQSQAVIVSPYGYQQPMLNTSSGLGDALQRAGDLATARNAE